MNLLRPAAFLLLVTTTFLFLVGCDKVIENFQRKQIEVDINLFRQAILDYRLEYGVLPLTDPTTEIQSNRDLYAMLHAPAGPMSGNPKGIGFIDAPSGVLVKGEFIDPWGTAYNVALDYDGDGTVALGEKVISVPIAIWSSGSNRLNEFGYGDDHRSWQ